MGLQDTSGKRLHATKLENGDHVVKARGDLNPKTFEKICKTIDEAIEDVVGNKAPNLVWLNAGSLVGDRATLEHAAHHHLWDAMFKLFPGSTDPVAEKHRRITVGAIIKWRVARRPEDWLVHYRETERKDVVSGDLIKASEFWIKPGGPIQSPTRARRPRENRTTVDDLKKKWSKGG